MSVGLIIILILLGIILFLIEFLLVPGITVAGISGAVLMIGGIILGYHHHGTQVGNLILLGTVVFSIIILYFVLKSRTWKNIMLDSRIEGKVNKLERDKGLIKTGDKGVSVTRLNPMGRIEVNGEYYEAKSLNRFVDENTPLIVRKISGNQIIVEPIKE